MEKELVSIRGYYFFKPSDKAPKTPTSAQTSVTLVAAVFFPSDIRVSFYLCFIFRRRLARAQCVHL